MSLSFQLLLHITLINIIIAVIQPNMENQTTTIYISSENNGNFTNNQLSCLTETCIIKCDIYRACYYTTVNVSSLTNNLVLSCTDLDSCYRINILNGPSNSIQIKCLNDSSCEYAVFNVENTINVDIECNFDMTGSITESRAACYYAKFNANYSSNVQVKCDRRYGCYKAQFNVNHSNTVTFNSDYYGMYYATIIATNVKTNFVLNCLQSYSCRSLTLHCPNNISCNVDCVGSWACYSIDVYGGNGNNALCDLNCLSSYSCQYALVYCGNNAPCNLNCDQTNSCYNSKVYCGTNSECNLNCNGVESCVSANIYINTELNPYLNWNCVGSESCNHAYLNCLDTGNITEYIYSIGHSQHFCLNDGCCPFGQHNRKQLNCSMLFGVGMECNINCTEYGGCYLAQIDASQSSSLNVMCSSPSECEYANIYCPHLAECNIYCLSTQSCIYLNVYSEKPILSLSLICSGTESCIYSNINLNITENANILCAASHSCRDGTFNVEAASVFINAKGRSHQQALQSSRVTISDGNRLDVICSQPGSCYSLDVVYSHLNSINVECKHEYSCYNADFEYNVVENMEIHCAQINSCQYLNVRTTIANSLTITSTNTENIYDAEVWASCSSGCMNVFNCMANITFYCGSTATPYPISFGDQCRNCLCEIPQNQIQYTKAI
eukprot:154726_1